MDRYQIANYLLEGLSIEEMVRPTKPSNVKTKYKMKNSGTVFANKLRYKEFVTKKGTKVFVAFKDLSGTNECTISFETNESHDHKDLNDPEVLKNVLYIVRKELDKKNYEYVKIEPKVDVDSVNPNVRFKIFKKLIQEYFKDYEIISELSNPRYDTDSIVMRKK